MVAGAHGSHVQHRPALLKILNTQRILRVIHDNDGISRAQIAKICRMSKPTASMAVAELLNRKLVMETGKYSESVGRKGEKLSLNTYVNTAWILGVLVGVKETKVISGNLKGALLEYTAAFTTPQSYDGFLQKLYSACESVMRNFSILPIGCGISMPGMGNDNTGEIHLCPNIRFLDGKNIVHELENRFGFKAVQIQEVRALALGALQYEKEAKSRNLFCLSIGDGVGGAIVLNGELFHGTHNASGEIGHFPLPGNSRVCGCGKTGCLETVAATPGLLQTWKETFQPPENLENFFDVCKKFPQQAREVFLAVMPDIALAMRAVIQIVDPEVLMLGGPIWHLMPEAANKLKEFLPDRLDVITPGTTFAHGAFASVFHRVIVRSLALPYEE
ncbi:MAG: ROK family transcriptional regulator [Chitinispirillaceae bacterium]|nr:ROK family transcriptional regulator [Chitinispirillaceae bacterium]